MISGGVLREGSVPWRRRERGGEGDRHVRDGEMRGGGREVCERRSGGGREVCESCESHGESRNSGSTCRTRLVFASRPGPCRPARPGPRTCAANCQSADTAIAALLRCLRKVGEGGAAGQPAQQIGCCAYRPSTLPSSGSFVPGPWLKLSAAWACTIPSPRANDPIRPRQRQSLSGPERRAAAAQLAQRSCGGF